MDNVYLFIRRLTVAPIMAAFLLLTLWAARPGIFGGPAGFILSLLFLTVFPLLAYPLQKFIPRYKDKGREGQRSLAMLFAVAGYILGCLSNLLLPSAGGLWIIYLEYLLSGMLILFFNKALHRKISGHSCGAMAPAVIFFYFGLYPAAIAGLAAEALVCLASLRTGRHTAGQLAGGAAVSALAACFLALVFH